MKANASADIVRGQDRSPPPTLVRHLGVGLAAGVFVAACVAQTMLPRPLANTVAQIPPNLPLLILGLGGGLAAGGCVWALRILFGSWRQP